MPKAILNFIREPQRVWTYNEYTGVVAEAYLFATKQPGQSLMVDFSGLARPVAAPRHPDGRLPAGCYASLREAQAVRAAHLRRRAVGAGLDPA